MPNAMGILGKKLGMTRIFSEDGSAVGVTVVETGPCVVLQKKTVENDGYNAIQVGFTPRREKTLNKATAGHCRAAGQGGFYHIKEFRTEKVNEFEVGQQVQLSDLFKVGDLVDVTGNTKGRGFQGVMKRHGFHGGGATHGSMFHRAPGSIGCSAWPSRVIKGKKLPGQMGDATKTKKNLIVIDVRPEENLLVLKGSVPGPKNGILKIYSKAKS